MLRRIDASGRKGDVAFFATSVISPSDRANPWSCFAVVENGRWIFESPDATAELSGTTLGGTGDRYPVPSRIVWRDGGTTLTIEPQRELLRVEPLDVVPQPFRLLLALRSSPRRIWAETRGHLRLSQRASGESLDLSTVGTVAIGYTNPW